VRVASTNVTPELLEAVLVFAPGEPLRTSEVPGLAAAALEVLPGLKGHRCRNGAALGFAHELEDTELAHLVEHATLELMAMAGSPETLRGATSWDFAADGPRTFRVSVAWDDDLVALGSLRCASALVCALASGEKHPNVTAEARRLRSLRRR
jgi:hypothetical protein